MEAYATAIAKESLYLVLYLTFPPVLTAMTVGLMISLVQATTQIQEQTLTFVPKMVSVVIIIALLGPLGMTKLIGFTKALLLQFPEFIK